MVETLILMDLHRESSSPLARQPLGQGTDSEQTPSSYTVWMVGVGVPTQLARIRSIKTSSMGNLCRFGLSWMLVLGGLTTGTTVLEKDLSVDPISLARVHRGSYYLTSGKLKG